MDDFEIRRRVLAKFYEMYKTGRPLKVDMAEWSESWGVPKRQVGFAFKYLVDRGLLEGEYVAGTDIPVITDITPAGIDVLESGPVGKGANPAEPASTSESNKMTKGDQRFMRIAIQESTKSKDEKDGRMHPKVGAVVVKDGKVIATAHRGEIALGDHAEYTALERKLPSTDLNGAAIYTTLEPCTSRRHKTPCADRIVQRKIRRVVIGVLDPNPSIKGGSVYTLKQAGIDVSFAEANLERKIKALNKAFLEQQQTAAMLGFDVKLQLDSHKARANSITEGIPTGWEVFYTFFNEGTKPGRVFDSTITVVLNPLPDDVVCKPSPFGPRDNSDFLVYPDKPEIGKASVSLYPKVKGIGWASGLKQLVNRKQVAIEVHIDFSVGDQAKRFPRREHHVLEAELP